ncbi:hypothetical protein B7463_g7109, partial [Scytalidium lignicola]
MSSTTQMDPRDIFNSPDITSLYRAAEKVTGAFAKIMIEQSGVTTTKEQPLVLLDQGSGLGAVATALHEALDKTPEKEWHLTCADISKPMMETLQNKIQTEGWQNTEVIHADMQKSGLPSSHYSHVFASFVLMMLPESQAALDDCLRILKPGGTIAFTTWQQFAWVDIANATVALLSDDLPQVSCEEFLGAFQKGDWQDPSWLELQLKSRQLTDIEIKVVSKKIEASAQEIGLATTPPMTMIMSRFWTEEQRQKYGPKLMPRIIKYMEDTYTQDNPAEGENFILKNTIPGEFQYQQDLQNSLTSSPNIRTVIDTVPDFELFVYRFLAGDLLRISRKPLSQETRRSILRSALTGLAELHERGIIHTDIKPNNILLDYEKVADDDLIIQSVQISDLEDAVLLPPSKNLKDCLCGNQLWRSPESWARAKQNTPSDIFSFGVVIIYVMLDEMIFRASDEELSGDDSWWYILRRHISFFADEDGFKGLLQHIGEENIFFERLIALAGDFDAERRRSPFMMWNYVDVELRDLIVKMTNLDPGRRITAREALEHPWFRQNGAGQKV